MSDLPPGPRVPTQRVPDPLGTASRRAALRLLDAVLRRGESLEQALPGATRAVHGPDRGLAHAIAAEALRWLPDLDTLIDGATKQRMRAVPILKSELAAGRSGEGAYFSVAAWIAFVLGTEDIRDTRVAEILVARQQDDAVQALIAVLDEDLGNNPEFVERIRMQVSQLS